MKIIPQIAIKMVEKVTENLRTTGINSIGQAINELVPIVNETVLEILKAVIEETDEILLRGTKKLRKEDGISIKEKNIERTVLTDIGELKFRRTYFKTENGYVYLTDQVIGIESYERITKELVAKILEAAGEVSYEKAGEITGQKVTRQTVHNRLRALKEVVTEVSKKETPKEIDIFADEDHVNIRGGKNAIVPLITITEGIDTSNEKRHKTKEPLHIAAYGMEAEALRENVLAVLCERYDLEKAEKINVHGDGAGWINNLSKTLPKANLIIDGYHFEKELRSFLSLKGASGYEKRIREAFLKEDGYDDFEECIMKIRDRQETEKDIEKLVLEMKADGIETNYIYIDHNNISAKISKKHNVILIVDEAHGALYPFSDNLPESAVRYADFTVQSLHKTAGGINPTALLHSNCDLDIQSALSMINTTSPSYPMLATIEANINFLNSKRGKRKIEELIGQIKLIEEKLGI